MSLVWKFFISYLVVMAVGLVVLSASAACVAPDNFSRSMDTMMDDMSGSGTQSDPWMGQYNGVPSQSPFIISILDIF